MEFSKTLSATHPPSKEDDDQRERSVKKTKYGKRDWEMSNVEYVPKSRMESNMDQAREAMNGRLITQSNPIGLANLSYKESLAGINTMPVSMKTDTDAYPDSDVMCMTLMRIKKTAL